MRVGRVVGLIVLLLLTSCTHLTMDPKDIQKPTVDLIGLRVGKLSFFEQKLIARLKVFNPNDLEVPVAFISCFLEVEDLMAANGIVSKPFVVPALGEHEFDMVISTSILKLSRPISKLIKSHKKRVEYRVSGQLKVDLLFVGPFDFEKKGSVDLEH